MNFVEAILHCPYCHRQHIDEGAWAQREHKTHLCAHCGQEFDVSHPVCVGVAGHGTIEDFRRQLIAELKAAIPRCSPVLVDVIKVIENFHPRQRP